MHVVFIGTVSFSRACLEQLFELGADVVGVVTLEPGRRAQAGDAADLEPVARANGVPVHHVRNVNDPDVVELIRSLNPDVILVLGWSQLLGPELLSVAPCIGSHPALLPRDRGRHPITWALVDGLEESGLTFLWLDAGADSGDILWQRSFSIDEDDDACSVYARVEELGRRAIAEFLPQLEAGTAPRRPQDESAASYRRKRTDDDRWIDWRRPSREIHNLVRGLSRPYVGALTRIRGEDVVVWKVHPADGAVEESANASAAGTVVELDDALAVRTGTGWLRLVEVEPADRLRPGDILGGKP
jgi:methionyl-tRNA formyltransferase